MFRFESCEVVDEDLVDYHCSRRIRTMTMLNPCHPGKTLRDDLEAAGLTVTGAAGKLGCTRQALSRLLNGKAGISPRNGDDRQPVSPKK